MLLQYSYAKAEQTVGFLQQWWGEMTSNPEDVMNGRRKNLLGRIRELHTIAATLAQKDDCSKQK